MDRLGRWKSAACSWPGSLAISAVWIALWTLAAGASPAWDDFKLIQDFHANGMPSWSAAFDAICAQYQRPLGVWSIYLPMRLGLGARGDAALNGALLWALCVLAAMLAAPAGSRRPKALLACAALAACFPALAEPWIWLSARFDLLMALCAMGAAWLAARSEARGARLAACAAALACAAGLSKETAAALAPLWALGWSLWLWRAAPLRSMAFGVGALAGWLAWLALLRGPHLLPEFDRGLADSAGAWGQGMLRSSWALAGGFLERAPSPQIWPGQWAPWCAAGVAALGMELALLGAALRRRSLPLMCCALGLLHAAALSWASVAMNPDTRMLFATRSLAPGAALMLAGAAGLCLRSARARWIVLALALAGAWPAFEARSAWSSDLSLWSAQVRGAEPTAFSALNMGAATLAAGSPGEALLWGSKAAALSEGLSRGAGPMGCRAQALRAEALAGLGRPLDPEAMAWEESSQCSPLLTARVAGALAAAGQCERALGAYRRLAQAVRSGEASAPPAAMLAGLGANWLALESACGDPEGKSAASAWARPRPPAPSGH